MQLRVVRDKVLRPAPADLRAVPDHWSGTHDAVTCAAAEPVLAACACIALGGNTALPAREHWVDDHALAGLKRAGGGARLVDDAHVLVAEGKRIGAERLERE